MQHTVWAYVKALLSRMGAYLISDLPKEGLIERGAYYKGLINKIKYSSKDIFGSFSVLLFHIMRNQHTILRLKYST